MTLEQIEAQLYRVNTQYVNGLDYIRQNPNAITVEEVQSHLQVVRERRALMELLED
jgi:hypothetical protein